MPPEYLPLKSDKEVVFFKSPGFIPQIFGPINLSVSRPYFTVLGL